MDAGQRMGSKVVARRRPLPRAQATFVPSMGSQAIAVPLDHESFPAMPIRQPFLLVLGLLLLAPACRKGADDPIAPSPPVHEEEVVTTVRIDLQSTGGAQHRTFIYRDPDGDGGAAPIITADTLSADTLYTAHVHFLNESVDPAEDITHEIEEEGTSHQVFHIVSGAPLTITYADADANGHPIGLQCMWAAGPAGSGTLTLVLRHGPQKDAPGVADGDITLAGGETDISVEFPVVVE